MSDPSSQSDRTYAVFISYRHADNQEQGRQWASWLHHTLETYEIPPEFIGRRSLRGTPVPPSLYPVFRDEEELPADADLSANIHRALRNSSLLVVLCSPRAAKSKFVADEVRAFKEMGKSDCILALLIDGEPNASDDPGKADDGFLPDQECLPYPLRYGVQLADGSIDWAQRTEPIAADVRPGNRPEQGWTNPSAYRDTLRQQGFQTAEADRRTQAYHEQLKLATLKIIAGALGIPLGDLTARDKRYAEEKLKRVRSELSRTEFLFAGHLLQLKDYRKAHSRLSRSLQAEPTNQSATILALEQFRSQVNRGTLCKFKATGARFSPAGSHLVMWIDDEAAIWDICSGKEALSAFRHEGRVLSSDFGPNGSSLVTASSDRSVRIWSARDGSILAQFPHSDEVASAIFSLDGKYVLSLCRNFNVYLWDVNGASSPFAKLDHSSEVTHIALSPDGEHVMTSTYKGEVKIWQLRTGVHVKGFQAHSRSILSACFNSDGTKILTASEDCTAKLWDSSTCQQILTFKHKQLVASAVFSPDGTRVLTASGDYTAQQWDASSGEPVGSPLRHTRKVNCASYSPDGKLILTASRDQTVQLWESGNSEVYITSFNQGIGARSAHFSPDGSRILTLDSASSVTLWDLPTKALPETFYSTHFANFTSGGDLALINQDGTEAKVWDPSTRVTKLNLNEGADRIKSIWISNYRKLIAVSTDKLECYIWNLSGTPSRKRLNCPQGLDQSVIFSPDDKQVVTMSGPDYKSRCVMLWSSETATQIAAPLHEHAKIQFVRFSRNRLLTVLDLGNSNDRVYIWDAATAMPACQPLEPGGMVHSAVFSQAGDILYTLSGNSRRGLLQAWKVSSDCPIELPLPRRIESKVFILSPDGERYLTRDSNSMQFRLWNARTHDEITSDDPSLWRGHFAGFSPSGNLVTVAAYHRTLNIFKSTDGALLSDPFPVGASVESVVFSSCETRVLVGCGELQAGSIDVGYAQLVDVLSAQPLTAPYTHRYKVATIDFCPLTARVITRSADGVTKLWDASEDSLNQNDAAFVTNLLEHNPTTIACSSKLAFAAQADGSFPNNDLSIGNQRIANRLLLWWLRDPFLRPINPSSNISVPSFVRHCIRMLLEDARGNLKLVLQDAQEAFAHSPLVLLCEADDEQCQNSVWLRQFAVSRLMSDPHYLTPMHLESSPRDESGTWREELTLGLGEDCFWGARLLLSDYANQTWTRDPQRIKMAEKVLVRALTLDPKREAYWKLAGRLGI